MGLVTLPSSDEHGGLLESVSRRPATAVPCCYKQPAVYFRLLLPISVPLQAEYEATKFQYGQLAIDRLLPPKLSDVFPKIPCNIREVVL